MSLESIRNIISDVASGRIKDGKIVVLAEQVGVLDAQLSEKNLLIANLTSKIESLELQLSDLQPPDRIPPDVENLLKSLYAESSQFTRPKVSNKFGISEEDANHRLNILLTRGYISVTGQGASVKGRAMDIMKLTEAGMTYVQIHLKPA